MLQWKPQEEKTHAADRGIAAVAEPQRQGTGKTSTRDKRVEDERGGHTFRQRAWYENNSILGASRASV